MTGLYAHIKVHIITLTIYYVTDGLDAFKSSAQRFNLIVIELASEFDNLRNIIT